MTVLRRHEYGDPLEIMLRREAETCKGCTHEQKVVAWGKEYLVCDLKTKKHGDRCKFYTETK